jgi:hypothetical protein
VRDAPVWSGFIEWISATERFMPSPRLVTGDQQSSKTDFGN